MKKLIFIAITTIGLVSVSFAQRSDEFRDLSEWLGKYYCEQNNVEWISSNDPRYAEYKAKGEGIFSLPPLTLQSDMYNKIKQEYPMDPSLQVAITAIENQKAASYLAIAQRYGYSSWDEFWNNAKGDSRVDLNEIWKERNEIDMESGKEYSRVTGAYWTEFNKRYETAVIEAIKRIQENSKAMK